MKYKTQQRRDDWIAFVDGHPEQWDAGETEAEAVRKLKRSNATKIDSGAEWTSRLAQAIRDSDPGDIILVENEAQKEFGERAAKRMGQDVIFEIF